MAQVSIDSLEIENFGPFHGKHIFQFTPLDGRASVLIGGKNGAGKTHLLRALYLATVGESGRIDLKKLDSGSDATRFEISHSLNRRARARGDFDSRLAVTISQNDPSSPGVPLVALGPQKLC